MAKQQICIIGGGIAGLAAALYYPKTKNRQIILYEKEKYLGGLASTKSILNGLPIERFYHFVYGNEGKDISQFFTDVGIKPIIHWRQIRTAIYHQGQIYPIDTPIEILNLPGMSVIQKLRFIFGTAYILVSPYNLREDSISVAKYLKKLVGDKPYKIVWLPLLKSKFSNNYKQVPASWIKARIKSFSARKTNKFTTFGYIENTYAQLYTAIQKKLTLQGVKIVHLPIQKITISKQQVRSITVNNSQKKFDHYIFTLPLSTIRTLTTNKAFISKFNHFQDLHSLVLLLVTKSSLSNYYWININKKGAPFAGIIEHTNLYDQSHYRGYSLIYLTKYLSSNHRLIKLLKKDQPRQQLIKEWIAYLHQIIPTFSEDSVVETHLSLGEGAAPVPFINYPAHIPDFSLGLANAHFINAAMIYPADRGTGNTVELAKKMIKTVTNEKN